MTKELEVDDEEVAGKVGKVGDQTKASQYFRNMCLLVKNPESPATIFERWKVMDHPILKEFPRGVRFYVDGTEIRCDIPSNSTRAQAAYSSYKHYHTHKFQL